MRAWRCGPRGGRAWGGGASSVLWRPDSRLGAWQRARAERTSNIWFMFVTLEVSQPDMSALNEAWLVLEKSALMSVTDETCQVEMGPYVVVAEAALELYAESAVCNSPLVAIFLLQSVLQAPCGSPPCGKVSLVSVMHTSFPAQ